MKYRIIWSAFSELQIDDIFDYYQQNANKKVAKTIVRQILLAPNVLINNPKIGQKEPALAHRSIVYH